MITWEPHFSVDRGVIDDDHHALIAIINEFVNPRIALPDALALGNVLLKLDRYTKMHLRREELLQIKIGFPHLDTHRQQHEALIARLNAMRRDFRLDAGPRQVAAAHRDVAALLDTWLTDHILQSDLRMRPYGAALRRGAAGFADLSRTDSTEL